MGPSKLDKLDQKMADNVISYLARLKGIVQWISMVIEAPIEDNFLESLTCGQILCKVVNKLSPSVITLNNIKSKGMFSLEFAFIYLRF